VAAVSAVGVVVVVSSSLGGGGGGGYDGGGGRGCDSGWKAVVVKLSLSFVSSSFV
jgi:hypothetical protein